MYETNDFLDPNRVAYRNVIIHALAPDGNSHDDLQSTGFFQANYCDNSNPLPSVTFRQVFEELSPDFWWPACFKGLGIDDPYN